MSNFEFLRPQTSSSWNLRVSTRPRVRFQTRCQKKLTIQQSAALEQMVSTNPMVSATTARRGLELLPDYASKISPSKQRLVARAVSAARPRPILPSAHDLSSQPSSKLNVRPLPLESTSASQPDVMFQSTNEVCNSFTAAHSRARLPGSFAPGARPHERALAPARTSARPHLLPAQRSLPLPV